MTEITAKASKIFKAIGNEITHPERLEERFETLFDHIGVWQATVNFLGVSAKEDLADPSSEYRKRFDKKRAELEQDLTVMLKPGEFDKRISRDRLEEIVRHTYANLSRKFLNLSLKTGDKNLSNEYKGLARSILAKDADRVLKSSNNRSISNDWLALFWRAINVAHPDIKTINQELNKFEQNDPSAFSIIPGPENVGQRRLLPGRGI